VSLAAPTRLNTSDGSGLVCQGISDAMMDVVLAARALISFAGIILVHLASSSDVSSRASRPLAVSLNAALPVSVLRGAI